MLFNCLILHLYQRYSSPKQITVSPHTIYISNVFKKGGVTDNQISNGNMRTLMTNSILRYCAFILIIDFNISELESTHRLTLLMAKYSLIPQMIPTAIIAQNETSHTTGSFVGDHKCDVAKRIIHANENSSPKKTFLKRRVLTSFLFARQASSF